MPLKGAGEPELKTIDRFEHGVGWIAYPDEGMQRASHALVVPTDDDNDDHDDHGDNNESDDSDDSEDNDDSDDSDDSNNSDGDPEVWVVDPVDAPGVDDLIESLGTVAGVVIALDRHKRDSAAIANRHDVPVFVPTWMDGVASDLDATIARFSGELADTGFRALQVRNSTVPPWQEVGLYDGETLVVPEAVGTADFFRAGDERLGVHPMLRLTPPRNVLGGLTPDRILVGHGSGIHEDAGEALAEALDGSRRRAPAAFTKALKSFVGR